MEQQYIVYKQVKSKEQFFSNWDSETYTNLNDELKEHIYKKYVIKCTVYQRDNFTCQNSLCETPQSSLTLHHIRFQKNGGETTVRNCITLCRTCHKGYHSGRKVIKIRDDPVLPSHIRGHAFQITKAEQIDWKQWRKIARTIRQNNKHLHGLGIDVELIIKLIRWLYVPYYEMSEDDEIEDNN